MNKKIVIGAFLFLAVVMGATKIHGGDKKEPATPLAGKNAMMVGDQKVGNIITVSSAILERKGFIVVQELENGQLEKIIGSSALLPVGASNNVTIPLREPMKEGKSYATTIHFDNGDEFFLPGKDFPAMNDDANAGPIKTEFHAVSEGGA